ncbi:MAG: alpha/beta fold hydrolase [Bacteroidota bacterium]
MKQAILFLPLILMSQTALTQAWVDTQQYPFEHRYLPLESGRMHYVDEGQGEVLLFVHGTPTWSFLYRHFIRELSQEYRCIAIDHLGFGLSDDPQGISATPEWHANNLSAFIEALDLQNVTLVVHDFGGPIGLGAGIEQADRIQQVVLFNSWLWATAEERSVQKIDQTVNSWLGRFLYLRLNISPRVLLKKAFTDKRHLPKAVHQQYVYPFPTRDSRQPLLDLGKALAGSSAWYQQQWEQLGPLAAKDWLVLWGTEDPFITEDYLHVWESRLPQAKVIRFACGHFVQEERATESLEALRRFLKK